MGLLPKEQTEDFMDGLDRGQFQIPWPQLVTEGDARFDLLLATATNPEIDRARITDYRNPTTIARAWTNEKGKKHVYYFWCYEASGITTADDTEIRQHLQAPST